MSPLSLTADSTPRLSHTHRPTPGSSWVWVVMAVKTSTERW